MKSILSFCLFAVFALSPLSADKRSLSIEERKKLIYELNVKRAEDLVSAFSDLKSNLDRDHMIKAKFSSNKSVKKNHGLVSVKRFGELLNLKFADVDDKSDWVMVTVRVNEVSQFYSVEI